MPPILRLLLLPLLLGLAAQARAEIYRYYDQDGNLVLSDKVPKEGAEQARKLKPGTVMTVPSLAPAPKAGPPGKPAAAAAGYAIVIVSPAQGGSYPRAADPIPVALSVTPSLEAGHRMDFSLDGKGRAALESISTDDLKPGSHRLTVRVLDGKDKVLKSAEVDFEVR